MEQQLTFSLLGPIRAWRQGVELGLGSPHQRLTLAVLLLNLGHSVSSKTIADALWRDMATPSADGTVRTYIYRLRGVLRTEGDPVIVSAPGGYTIAANGIALDSALFSHEVAVAKAARAEGDSYRVAEHLRRALDRWQGPALDGVSGLFAETERLRLHQVRMAAVEELAAVDLELGRHAALVETLVKATDADPMREKLHELLMLALYRSGRQAEALAVYDRVRRLLRDELGLDPGRGLRDVHQGILRADLELSTPSQPTIPAVDVVITPVRPAQLPADLPAFVGRQAELADVVGMVANEGKPPAATVGLIHGMAGVGKTTFAVHAAHQVADRFPDGQLHLNLRGFDGGGETVASADALAAFLDALGVPPQRIPANPNALIGLYRSILADKRCLILLDNARTAEQVLPLLPGSPGCLVLVTSRGQLPGLVAAVGAHTVSLDLPSEDEAHEFLAGRLGAQRIASEPDAARDLIAICGRLPLALAVISARAVCNPAFTLSTVVAELHDEQHSLDAFASAGSLADLRVALSWSYQALTESAARLFRLMSLHPGTDITVPAAASLIAGTAAEARSALKELAGLSLAGEHVPGRFSRHDLLSAYAAELAEEHDSPAERQAAFHRLLDHHLHTAYAAAGQFGQYPDIMSISGPILGVCLRSPATYVDALAWYSAEHSTLLSLIERAPAAGFHDYCWQLAYCVRPFLDRSGNWRDLTTTQRTALHAAQQIGNRIGMAYAHRGIARVAAIRGCYDRSVQHLEKALRLFEQEGDKHAMGYTCRQEIFVRQMNNEYGTALRQARTALDMFRSLGDTFGEAATLNSTAWLLIAAGQANEAILRCTEAIAIYTQPGYRYDHAGLLDTLACAYSRSGQYDMAIETYRQSIELYRELAGQRCIAEVLTRLAATYSTAGREIEAHAARREAGAIMRELGMTMSAGALPTLTAVAD